MRDLTIEDLDRLEAQLGTVAGNSRLEELALSLIALARRSLTPTPAAVPDLEFEAFPLNGLVCAECRTPQRDTPHGASCENGHGGADGIDVAKAVT